MVEARAMIEVDARGLRCPWPVLRLARAMRDAGRQASVRIIADDPAAPAEIAALAAERGWALAVADETGFQCFTVTAAAAASTGCLPEGR